MSVVERIGRARNLPRPAPGRFRPLRAGILGVWEYDDQEFWFADGRLVLRGQNTAGKSKALELLLPFVLDGETRPERLDPFGNRSKTMYWNLIDFDPDPERRAALGYCWLEFGRTADNGAEQFVTVLVGMRATRAAGRKVETWFAVTPLRVGAQLNLAPGGRPVTADRLREALAGNGRVTTAARDYRAAVDAELFGLGADRYDALIHLLLQLRRPKLSEKLDLTKLTDVLTDALPPLERGRLDLLAQAFARLDAEAAELEALSASHRALTAFLAEYREYAQLQVRLRADAVRAANSQFDKVTEIERRERVEQDEAERALSVIEGRRTELDAELDTVRGQLAGLDLSKVHALHEVERRADEAERAARRERGRAGDDERLAIGVAAQAEAAAEEAEQAHRAAEAAVGATTAAAGEAGLAAEHAAHLDQLRTEPDAARDALEATAVRRLAHLRDLRVAAAAAEQARRGVERAEERLRQAEDDHAERQAERRAAAGESADAGTAFADAVDDWSATLDADLRALAPASDLGAEVLASTIAEEVTGAAARAAMAAHLAPVHAYVRAERDTAVSERTRLADERAELAAERARVEAQADDAPPPGAGRPAVRPHGSAPLWACVEFAPNLADAARAGLEAALHAAGLLDALVTADGRLLAADALDTLIDGPPAGDGLALWLVPAADSPVPSTAVRAALASVGLGEESGAACWVALDGRWANGPLHGHWAQPAARYVGAATRAATRARRVAELSERIAVVDTRLAGLDSRAAGLDRLEADAQEAAARFPSVTRLRDALVAVRTAETALAVAAAAADLARGDLDEQLAAATGVFAALAVAERLAGCPVGRADQASDAVAEYRMVLDRAATALRQAARERVRSVRLATEAEAARDRSAASAAAAADAESQARAYRAEAEELRSTVGADVAAVLARQHELEARLATATGEAQRLAAGRDAARDRLVEARTRLQGTEALRAERERERADALAAQARLAGTELAVLALGATDPERDLTQVTAGLTFARTAFDRLREVAVGPESQDSVTNRLHEAYTALRAQLAADFDPHLDTTDGVSVCVVRLAGQLVGATDLERALAKEIGLRRDTLSEDEREVIERHLLTEVGTHLGERMHAAWSLVERMNEQLTAHPTRSGVSLSLKWEADPAAGPTAVDALKLLRRDVGLLTATERATLAAFLAERVRAGRDDTEGADVVERLAVALDYRRWHRFAVHRRVRGGTEQFTARTQAFGSGGEQAKLAHLPLFAAMAGYYGSARPTAPRLLVLDEAFAGIDDDQRGDCMAMLVDLDLDPVLANFGEWGCYREVPHVAVYHLERAPGQPGVAALRFVWDGRELREDDPFLDERTALPLDDASLLT